MPTVVPPAGKELYFVDAAGRVDAAVVPASASGVVPGEPQVLFDASALVSASPYRTTVAVYPDGQHFLMHLRVPQKTPTTITVVQNWTPPKP